MAKRSTAQSSAFLWFLHRVTGVFLVFLLFTHFWVQHYDRQAASVTHEVVTEEGELPTYPEEAQAGVAARYGDDAEATPYQVVMQRLADPVYAVLWKGFNILFLIVALHHGFYGLNNVMTDYIRDPLGRLVARSLSWTVALGLLIIGLYSVITAGW